MVHSRDAYRILVAKLEGKTALGRARFEREKLLPWKGRRAWTGLIWRRTGVGARLL
jgi:hypothetical protein